MQFSGNADLKLLDEIKLALELSSANSKRKSPNRPQKEVEKQTCYLQTSA